MKIRIFLSILGIVALSSLALADETGLRQADDEVSREVAQAMLVAKPGDKDTRDIHGDDRANSTDPSNDLMFYGFFGVKSSRDFYEDSLCRRDMQQMEDKLKAALTAAGEDVAQYNVRAIIGKDNREPQRCFMGNGGYRRVSTPASCVPGRMVGSCGLRLTTDSSRFVFRFKRLPNVEDGDNASCARKIEAQRKQELANGAFIIDSHIITWGAGCRLQALELVAVLAEPGQ